MDVTPQGIAKKIDGLCYSIKQTRVEVDRMNNDENKNKRKIYAEQYMELLGNGFQPIFEDERNFNIHCRRSNARAKVGKRAFKYVFQAQEDETSTASEPSVLLVFLCWKLDEAL